MCLSEHHQFIHRFDFFGADAVPLSQHAKVRIFYRVSRRTIYRLTTSYFLHIMQVRTNAGFKSYAPFKLTRVRIALSFTTPRRPIVVWWLVTMSWIGIICSCDLKEALDVTVRNVSKTRPRSSRNLFRVTSAWTCAMLIDRHWVLSLCRRELDVLRVSSKSVNSDLHEYAIPTALNCPFWIT